MTILPQLERDLLRAAEQRLPAADAAERAGEDPRRRGARPNRRRDGFGRRLASTARTLPVLLVIAVTVIVAALAVTRFHHGGAARPAAPAAGVHATRQQLIDMLGVLRSPQTRADRDSELDPGFLAIASLPEQAARRHRRPPAGLERRLAQLGSPRLDGALVRVVRIPAWQAKVGIEPATWQPAPSSHRRAEGVDLELWIGSKPTIPPSSDDGTGPRPTSVETIRAHGLALTDNGRGEDMLDGVILVPDGVARITLRVRRLMGAPVRIDPSRFGAAAATVHDNIAAFRLTIPTAVSRHAFSGLFGTGAVAQVTWFNAGGDVIKRTTTTFDVLIKVSGKRAPPRPRGGERRR